MFSRVLKVSALVVAVALPLAQRTELSAQTTGAAVSSLTYLGKFSLPADFAYGGRGLAFNAARNSLFASGFIRSPMTAEVSIPAIGGTATFLQAMTDPTEGKSSQINPGDSSDKEVGGYLVYNNSLLLSVYSYYDGSSTANSSHFVRPLTLSTKGQVVGPTKVGSMNPGFYAGYMATIPAEWRAAFGGPVITGQAEISIIGRTSFGPSAFVIDPAKLTSTGAVPLVYYDQAHQTLGPWEHPTQGTSTPNPYPYVGIGDETTGVVFPDGTSSVLFFGRHGKTLCYGDGAPCGDPTDQYKGTHGYPYEPVMLIYKASDLAAVKAGTKQPWEVVPTARWVLPFSDSSGAYHISGAAWDPATRRIYVGQSFTQGDPSVIHVFTVSGASGPQPPSPPQNLRIIG